MQQQPPKRPSDKVRDITRPYYSRHKIVDLTCPRCNGRVTFLINEREHSIYGCLCGRWYKELNGLEIPPPATENWTYKAKEGTKP